MVQEKYLTDVNILNYIDSLQLRVLYARVTVLNNQDRPIATVEGAVSQGSININSTSAVRRTGSLTLITSMENMDLNHITDIDNLISINKRVEVEVGIENTGYEYEEYEKFWFPLGHFMITDASITHNISNLTINVKLTDKMALLNGEIGGTLPRAIVYSSPSDEERPTIYTLIKEIVSELGGISEDKIIIEVPTEIAALSSWNDSKSPLYRIEKTETEDVYYVPSLPESTEGLDITTFYYRDAVGYVDTPFVYPEELTSKNGDSVYSVLENIRKTLGNYEFFFDLNGNFRFKEIDNFLNEGSSYDDLTLAIADGYLINTSNNKAIYKFEEGSNLISSFQNNPYYKMVKNDYTVWGEKSGSKAEIQYHLVIDSKDLTEEQKSIVEDKTYYAVQLPPVTRYFTSLEEARQARIDYDNKALEDEEEAPEDEDIADGEGNETWIRTFNDTPNLSNMTGTWPVKFRLWVKNDTSLITPQVPQERLYEAIKITSDGKIEYSYFDGLSYDIEVAYENGVWINNKYKNIIIDLTSISSVALEEWLTENTTSTLITLPNTDDERRIWRLNNICSDQVRNMFTSILAKEGKAEIEIPIRLEEVVTKTIYSALRIMSVNGFLKIAVKQESNNKYVTLGMYELPPQENTNEVANEGAETINVYEIFRNEQGEILKSGVFSSYGAYSQYSSSTFGGYVDKEQERVIVQSIRAFKVLSDVNTNVAHYLFGCYYDKNEEDYKYYDPIIPTSPAIIAEEEVTFNSQGILFQPAYLLNTGEYWEIQNVDTFTKGILERHDELYSPNSNPADPYYCAGCNLSTFAIAFVNIYEENSKIPNHRELLNFNSHYYGYFAKVYDEHGEGPFPIFVPNIEQYLNDVYYKYYDIDMLFTQNSGISVTDKNYGFISLSDRFKAHSNIGDITEESGAIITYKVTTPTAPKNTQFKVMAPCILNPQIADLFIGDKNKKVCELVIDNEEKTENLSNTRWRFIKYEETKDGILGKKMFPGIVATQGYRDKNDFKDLNYLDTINLNYEIWGGSSPKDVKKLALCETIQSKITAENKYLIPNYAFTASCELNFDSILKVILSTKSSNEKKQAGPFAGQYGFRMDLEEKGYYYNSEISPTSYYEIRFPNKDQFVSREFYEQLCCFAEQIIEEQNATPAMFKLQRSVQVDDFGNWPVDAYITRFKYNASDLAALDWRSQRYLYYIATNDTTAIGRELVEFWPTVFSVQDNAWLKSMEDLHYYFDMIDVADADKVENRISESGRQALEDVFKFSVPNIDRRTKVITDKAVNCLFVEPLRDKEWLILDPNDPTLTEEERALTMKMQQQISQYPDRKYVPVKKEVFNKITNDISYTSAYDLLRAQLHEFLSYNENINLSTIPVYHLDVNNRITVEDEKSDIHGDYIIQSIQIPLTINGQMTINAKRAIERI